MSLRPADIDFDRIELVSFDCYGTLIDWETGILEALRPLLGAHGISATDSTVLRCYSEIEPALQAGPYRSYRTILREAVVWVKRSHAHRESSASRRVETEPSASVSDMAELADLLVRENKTP